VAELTRLGRTRLSANFFMRDFLYSEIAAVHGIPNIPDDPDLAIAAGRRLCEEILEPLQSAFGRIVIRSAYRSAALNAFGHRMTMNGDWAYGCASNRKNAARHIWDLRDEKGHMGATACVVVPSFWQRHRGEGEWRKLAWWIHDHLPYSHMAFFRTRFAFNIGWHERPVKEITSSVAPTGTLTRPVWSNHSGTHVEEWGGIKLLLNSAVDHQSRQEEDPERSAGAAA
jgi:hypothetical protein